MYVQEAKVARETKAVPSKRVSESPTERERREFLRRVALSVFLFRDSRVSYLELTGHPPASLAFFDARHFNLSDECRES